MSRKIEKNRHRFQARAAIRCTHWCGTRCLFFFYRIFSKFYLEKISKDPNFVISLPSAFI